MCTLDCPTSLTHLIHDENLVSRNFLATLVSFNKYERYTCAVIFSNALSMVRESYWSAMCMIWLLLDSWQEFSYIWCFILLLDFEMSDAQQEHALAIEHLLPRLAALRIELCPYHMSEGRFWKIYFVLLHSRLSKHDAELLSTPQVGHLVCYWFVHLSWLFFYCNHFSA